MLLLINVINLICFKKIQINKNMILIQIWNNTFYHQYLPTFNWKGKIRKTLTKNMCFSFKICLYSISIQAQMFMWSETCCCSIILILWWYQSDTFGTYLLNYINPKHNFIANIEKAWKSSYILCFHVLFSIQGELENWIE